MFENLVQSCTGRAVEDTDKCKFCKFGTSPDSETVVYVLCDGISISYHNYNISEWEFQYQSSDRVLNIDYCAVGRIEWEHDDGTFCYLWEQDVQVSAKSDHVSRYGFPTNHYHGLTVTINIDSAQESLKKYFPMFNINLEELWQLYRSKKDFFFRSQADIQKIFSDLVLVKDNISIDYMRLKIAELLMVLMNIRIPENSDKKTYFKRSYVEKVKLIKEYICENADKKITLLMLCEKFEIPMSVLKECFKATYGESVYAYAKQFRLQKAAYLIKATNLSITDIALEIGYENASKFISAFKEKFLLTPFQYRKHFS